LPMMAFRCDPCAVQRLRATTVTANHGGPSGPAVLKRGVSGAPLQPRPRPDREQRAYATRYFAAVFIFSYENTKSCLSCGLWQLKQAVRLAPVLGVPSALKA